MADLVISRRAVGVSLPAGIVAIAVAATIGYNLGFGSGAKLASPGSPAAPVEIPVAGEPER